MDLSVLATTSQSIFSYRDVPVILAVRFLIPPLLQQQHHQFLIAAFLILLILCPLAPLRRQSPTARTTSVGFRTPPLSQQRLWQRFFSSRFSSLLFRPNNNHQRPVQHVSGSESLRFRSSSSSIIRPLLLQRSFCREHTCNASRVVLSLLGQRQECQRALRIVGCYKLQPSQEHAFILDSLFFCSAPTAMTTNTP